VLNKLSTRPWRRTKEWMYRFKFFDLGTSWRWASRSGRFTLGERTSGTHWIGGWVAPEPVWMTWRRENSWPYRDSNSDSSVVQPVGSRYTDYVIPALQPVICTYTYICYMYMTKSDWKSNLALRTEVVVLILKFFLRTSGKLRAIIYTAVKHHVKWSVIKISLLFLWNKKISRHI
jgi:hypothetical protein